MRLLLSLVALCAGINLYPIERFLRRLGAHVTTFTTGSELTTFLKSRELPPVDAVFIDVSTPSVSGRLALNDIMSSSDINLPHLHVVAMTVDTEDRSACCGGVLLVCVCVWHADHGFLVFLLPGLYIDRGCSAVLPKPFTPNDVKQVFDTLFPSQ